MNSVAITFIIIALTVAFLGFSGIAGVDINIAWILATAIIFVLVCRVLGHHPHQRKLPFL
jgi:uncharacterized membrane protein YtjA (UPF0391 family)